MTTCRACGGVLGRDCYNEADCLDISRRQSQDDYYYTADLENYISILIYTIEQNGILVPEANYQEPSLVMKPIFGCDYGYTVDDDLPF